MAGSNFIIRGGADFSGISGALARTQQQIGTFQNKISASLKLIGIALGGLTFGSLIKDSAQAAMTVESSMNQISRIMGANSSEFGQWAETQAKSFGMARTEAYKYGAIYGNLISGFTKSTEETTKYTEQLIKASAVVASSTGRTMEDTMERIRSGLLGNTEAIEDLGINVNVAMIESTNAFKQFANGKSWQQLNFQTQQQIRLMAILEQANTKYGDSLAGTTATKQMMFVATLKNIQLNIGQAFLPIYNVVLPALTALADKVEAVTSYLSAFSQALFGKASNPAKAATTSIQNQAAAVSELGDATETAGKQAKGSVAGFDEINSLADNSGKVSDASGVSGIEPGLGNQPGSEPDTPGIIPHIQAVADNIKAQMKTLKDTIVQNKEIITSAIGGILAAFLAFKAIPFLANLPAVFSGIGTAISGLLAPVAIAAAAIGALVAAFLYLYQTNQGFRDQINEIWSGIAETLKDFYENTLKPIGDYFVNGFAKPIAEALHKNILPILADLFVGASQIFSDLLNLVITIFKDIWQAVKPAMDLVKTIIIDVLEIIKGLWDKYGQDIINNVRNLIKGLEETWQLIWTKIINPIIQPALEMLTKLWEEHLSGLISQVGEVVAKCVNGALELYNGFIKPIIDWLVVKLGPVIADVIGAAIQVFGGFLGVVSDVAKGVFKVLGGLIDFIVGVFTGDWKKAWGGVKDIFSGIFDTFGGIVKGALNLVIDAINGMLRFAVEGLNDFIQSTIKKVKKLPGISISIGPITAPEIPRLAKGGITNGEMVATIGDNPGGREVVSPLDDLKDIIASAVSTAMVNTMQLTQNQGSGQSTAVFNLDGVQFARAIIPSIDKEKRRIGNMAISQG